MLAQGINRVFRKARSREAKEAVPPYHLHARWIEYVQKKRWLRLF